MDIMNVKPADIKAGTEERKTRRQEDKILAKTLPTPVESQAIESASQAAMLGDALTGEDVQSQLATGAAVRTAAMGAQQDISINALMSALPGDAQVVDVAAGMAKAQEGQELKAAKDSTTDFADQIGAAFMEMTAIPQLLRTLGRDDEVDPNFEYMDVRDKAEAGFPEADRKFLRESVSAADLEQRLSELSTKQERLATLGAHGTSLAVAASLTGGLLDPVGIAAGLGVGKVAQMAGVGVKLYQTQALAGLTVGEGAAVVGAGLSAARRAPTTLGRNVAEGVAGNVLYEATLDAAGAHVTYSDYITAAGFGMVFGAGIHAIRGANRRVRTQTEEDLPADGPDLMNVKEAGDDLQARAAENNMDLYSEAQKRAGPGATPEEIKVEVDTIMQEQADQVNRIAFSEVPDQDRMLPLFDLKTADDGTVPSIDEVMLPVSEREAVANAYGVNDTTVENKVEREMMGEIFARAEGWNAANPFDPQRLDSILGRVPWLASTGLQLARSPNPVARMIAGTLLESTTGATGRRRTAAITKTMRERIYLNDLVGYEEAYRQWRKKNGGSGYKDVIGSEHRSRFDRLVAADRENRRLGVETTDNLHIRTAGDHLDQGYNRMRQDQQTVGTVGAARLGDTSIGYVHRALSPKWIMNATQAEVTALSNKLAEQLHVGWDDTAFARTIAARYVERARTQAYGGTSVPANLSSPEAATVLRDVLRSLSVADKDIDLAMGRFSRGGASHTKKRLDLDLSETIDVPGGTRFAMMNAFETDQANLYLQYARRVSGDVALTQYGIQGDAGMKLLRKSLEYGRDGQRTTPQEMEAFDQIAAEFFGRPLDGTGNKHLGNLRMLTAASRLGGMAFTQFAETANAVSLLGVTGALRYVGSLPGHIAKVAKGEQSELLKSIEVIGGPLGQDHRVVFPFQEPNDVRVYGRDSINAFDRMVRAGSNALPWMSGWHYMHAAQVQGISEQIVHKAFRYINKGEESPALTSMGLSDDLVTRLRADLPNIAQFDDTGKLIKLDMTKATDHASAAEFVQAVHRGGKQIIQGTYIGETGKWAHSDLMRMLVQFRSFSLTSMEKQWTRQRSDVGTAKAFGILMGQMSFALPIHLSRVMINSTGRDNREEYLETQLHPAMLARAVLNYTSISGLSGDVLDAGATLAGFSASGVRGGSGSALGNIPALGYLESGAKVFKEKDPREAIRMLPGGNLPFLTPVINYVAD